MAEESRIKSLRGPSRDSLNVVFTPVEVGAIDDMLDAYGGTREGIIFKALSLLYTIYENDPEAENVFIQRGNKRIAIPLK